MSYCVYFFSGFYRILPTSVHQSDMTFGYSIDITLTIVMFFVLLFDDSTLVNVCCIIKLVSLFLSFLETMHMYWEVKMHTKMTQSGIRLCQQKVDQTQVILYGLLVMVAVAIFLAT